MIYFSNGIYKFFISVFNNVVSKSCQILVSKAMLYFSMVDEDCTNKSELIKTNINVVNIFFCHLFENLVK